MLKKGEDRQVWKHGVEFKVAESIHHEGQMSELCFSLPKYVMKINIYFEGVLDKVLKS